MYYILFYKTVEDYIEKRKPFRELHLSHAKAAHERGELMLAGALADPAAGSDIVEQYRILLRRDIFNNGVD